MSFFTKESLELLRQRIDLPDLIGAYVELQRSGANYKALCPFHDEKTPSFGIQKGDQHYHCFGCGAHGDGIQFLMDHQKMSFVEAVESAADRYHVVLERTEDTFHRGGPRPAELREALQHACDLFHFNLCESQEGVEALKYLHERGLCAQTSQVV